MQQNFSFIPHFRKIKKGMEMLKKERKKQQKKMSISEEENFFIKLYENKWKK